MTQRAPSTGAATLTARLQAGRLCDVQLQLQRPQVSALLRGRSPAEALQLLALVFGVCTQAQLAAARAALAAADEHAPGVQFDAAVRDEAVRELLLAQAGTVTPALLSDALRQLADRTALMQWLGTLLGAPPDAWPQDGSLAGLQDWAAHSSAPLAIQTRERLQWPEPVAAPTRRLPAVSAADSAAWWTRLTPDFATRPEWRQAPAETGPVARHATQPLVQALQSRPLLQHWIARLIELLCCCGAQTPAAVGRVSAMTVGTGIGRAAVETARGTLLHEVQLDGGRITRYAIVAPTDWNLHPCGSAFHWLDGAAATDAGQARQLAVRALAALDPCVAVHCRIL